MGKSKIKTIIFSEDIVIDAIQKLIEKIEDAKADEIEIVKSGRELYLSNKRLKSLLEEIK